MNVGDKFLRSWGSGYATGTGPLPSLCRLAHSQWPSGHSLKMARRLMVFIRIDSQRAKTEHRTRGRRASYAFYSIDSKINIIFF